MADNSVSDHKQCSRCGQVKPIERYALMGTIFLKNGEPRRYKAAECLDCQAEYARLRRAGLRREPKPQKSERKCCTCAIVKSNTEFHQQRYERGIRFKSECKSCGSARGKILRQADPEKWKQKCRNWRKQHPDERLAYDREYRDKNREKWQIYGRKNYANRKAAKFNPASPATKEAVAQTLAQARFGDQYLDAYSGELIDDPTIDHIVPLSKGGTSDPDNLCVTSKANNASKHNNDLLIWLVKRAQQSRNSS